MTGPDIVIVSLGLMLGYWIVSSVFVRPSKTPTAPGEEAPAVGTEGDPLDATTTAAAAWPTVLSLSTDASVDDIRRSYKVLRSQYHPHEVANLGGELQALAERKSKEIGMAYRQAMRERGVSEQLW